ncbi:hypothetical protein RF11_10220 [Thelohanellus kitauei]|uniref:Uncharacterized protein n=1 Tax=Thelohanellus kitauei TaxID=669202 RepID=A0A0C2JJS3_THEKT|nr:hypothetical protein RF11_10220 [Thelohanellus kitauei]
MNYFELVNDDPPVYHQMNRFFQTKPIQIPDDHPYRGKLSKGQDVIVIDQTSRQNLIYSHYFSEYKCILPDRNFFISTHIISDNLKAYFHRYPFTYILSLLFTNCLYYSCYSFSGKFAVISLMLIYLVMRNKRLVDSLQICEDTFKDAWYGYGQLQSPYWRTSEQSKKNWYKILLLNLNLINPNRLAKPDISGWESERIKNVKALMKQKGKNQNEPQNGH